MIQYNCTFQNIALAYLLQYVALKARNTRASRCNLFDRVIEKRHKEMYKVNKANTERYRQSAVPYLQRLLNEEEQVKFNEKKRYIWVKIKVKSLKQLM